MPASVVLLSGSKARTGHCSTRQSSPARPIASALVVACSITVPKRCQAGSPVTNTAARPVVWSISCATKHLPKRKKTPNRDGLGPQRPKQFFDLPASKEAAGRSKKEKSFLLATGTRAERTKGMPRAGPQHLYSGVRSRAWQGDSGDLSIAQSSQHAVGPLLLAACGLQQFSGPTFPPCSRRHPYCFRQQSHRI